MKFQKAELSYKDRAIFRPLSKASSYEEFDTRWMGPCEMEAGMGGMAAHCGCPPWVPVSSPLGAEA